MLNQANFGGGWGNHFEPDPAEEQPERDATERLAQLEYLESTVKRYLSARDGDVELIESAYVEMCKYFGIEPQRHDGNDGWDEDIL